MGRFRDWLTRITSTGEVELRGDGGQVVRGLPPGTPYADPRVAGYGALMSVDYLACEQTKARSLASLPVSVVVTGPDGRHRLADHPLARLLSGSANEDMSAVDLLQWLALRRDTFGTAYLRVSWWRGRPTAIWPVTCHVSHSFDRDAPRGRRSTWTLHGGDDYNPAGTYFRDEVIAIKTAVTKDGVSGQSLAALAASQLGLSVDLERFYSQMLNNGNHQLGHVELEDKRLPPEDMERLREAVEAKRGIAGAGKTPVFTAGAKWVNDRQTMQDASLVDEQVWVLQQVCRATNVPPWKVYDSTGTTYAAGQQANIDYVTDTILPEVRAIEKAFQPVLDSCAIPGMEGTASLKFSMQGLMRGDDDSRAAYYRELGYIGAITRADIREKEDMDPIDGLDRPLFPLNYGTVSEDGSVTVYAQDVDGTADGNEAGVTG